MVPHPAAKQVVPGVLREYASFLRTERGLQPLSIEAYRADLLQFAGQLAAAERSLPEATREDVAGFFAVLAGRGISARAAARKLSSLRGLYRWLLRAGRITIDPTQHVSTPSGWRVLPKTLAENTVDAALTEAEARVERARGKRAGSRSPVSVDEALAIRDAAILEVLYAGGLRATEVATLTGSGLNLEGSCLRVLGKGDKERLVPIGRAAVLALERYLAVGRPVLGAVAPHEPRLFLSARAAPISRQVVWQLVKQAVGPAASPHMLRHSCATHMVDHGADLRSVQTVLGHADIATTQMYTHVALGRLRAVHRAHHPRQQRQAGSDAAPAPPVAP